MEFSSLTFLFIFLPLSLAIYFLVPKQARNLMLLLVSLVFYAWGEPVYVLIMFLSIAIDFTHGQLVEKFRANDPLARWFTAQSVICNLALLGFFKYAGFFTTQLSHIPGVNITPVHIPLPIGISFFTFQTMSYTIDVYRGDAPVQKNIIDFGAFVTMFPQLIAGPVVKYKTIAEDLNPDHRVCSSEKFSAGIQRFCVGLSKKILLANAIGSLWEISLSRQMDGSLTVLGGWIGLLAFSFQIYFDFSGYSDMAIGLGLILGFHFPENFNYPYRAISITDFWHRWHISLTSWFREYLYIPLGGSRQGNLRTIRNILIVWFCTGFWHGASWNFMLWGLYFAFWLLLEKYVLRNILPRVPVALRYMATLFIVMTGWGLFAIEDLSACADYLLCCFGRGIFRSARDMYLLREYLVIIFLLIPASVCPGKVLWERIPTRIQRILSPVLVICSLCLCTAYLVDGSYNPFLYFRF